MLISKIRRLLYTIAKFLGDINAVRKGRLKQRIKNRIVGKYAGRRLFK